MGKSSKTPAMVDPDPGLSPARLSPLDLLRVGGSGLRARKLRAGLSALGIAVGIAAIVAVLGVSASSQANLLAELGRLGNLLTVAPGNTVTGTAVPLPSTAVGMIKRIPPVSSVAAVGVVPGAAVYRSAAIPAAQSGGISVSAAETNLLQTLGGSVAHGEFLNTANSHFPAVVLGYSAAEVLGIADLRIPAQVDISGIYFTVVGILNPVALAPEIDDSALIGFPIADSLLLYDGQATEIYLRANPNEVAPVQGVLAATANPIEPDAVVVSRPSDVLAARADTKGAFSSLVLGLGAVTLLVGGIGIANVMVVSVLERRGEIGLRRALGATRAQIGLQFLTEALLLAACGGAAGIALGIAGTAAYAMASSETSAVPSAAIWIGLGSAIAVGMLAGIYPALRAARLAPTDALRGT